MPLKPQAAALEEVPADSQSARRADLDAKEAVLDRRQSEQDVRESEQNERERLRQMLTATLSHDLRNPLSTIITGAAVLMKSGNLGEREARTVARMARGADRMQRMIEQLLDVTRIQLGGGLVLQRRDVDANRVAREVVDELAPVHAAHTITVTKADDGVGRWDRDRLAEMLSNLIGNALQHSPPAEAVCVRLVRTGGRLTIDVANGGPPIPPTLLPHIFDPFRSGRTGGDGLGLGLYITREIVLAHGGSIRVESSEEEGTTFRVELPI